MAVTETPGKNSSANFKRTNSEEIETFFGNTKITDMCSSESARVSPKQAVPNPPLLNGGNSHPNINTFNGIDKVSKNRLTQKGPPYLAFDTFIIAHCYCSFLRNVHKKSRTDNCAGLRESRGFLQFTN